MCITGPEVKNDGGKQKKNNNEKQNKTTGKQKESVGQGKFVRMYFFLHWCGKWMALPPPKIGRQGAFLVPPKWDEYIPKKNRHSESVRDGRRDHEMNGRGASDPVPKQVGDRDPKMTPGRKPTYLYGRGGKAYSTQCSQVVAHLSTNWA